MLPLRGAVLLGKRPASERIAAAADDDDDDDAAAAAAAAAAPAGAVRFRAGAGR